MLFGRATPALPARARLNVVVGNPATASTARNEVPSSATRREGEDQAA